MPKSKNVLSSSDVITNISKNIDKPNFLYNEILKFDDLYNKVKKHPVNFSRSIDCLSKFLILNAIYFLVVKKYFELSLLHFFMIPIFFVISLCWTIKKTKKSISKLVLMSNSKFYFYNNFLIIESEDCLEKIPYNKILFIKEGKTRFYFSTKSKSFVIEKDKINSKFNDFLNELIKQYKNIQEDSSDILFWDFLHKYMGNYRLYCINEKNEKNLTNYYHTKKVFKSFFIYIMCLNFIIAIGIFYIFNIHFSNFTEIIIYIFFIIILTVLSISNDIKYRVKRILQKKQEKIYFYNDFLFIKNEEIIFKCDYDCIKSFIEDNEFIFIKIKQLLSPIIINKKSIQNININF